MSRQTHHIAIVIPADPADPVRMERIATDKARHLTEMQRLVGGYIERVPYAYCGRQKVELFVNEDGIAEGLPPNPRASALVPADVAMLNGSLYGTALLTMAGGRRLDAQTAARLADEIERSVAGEPTT